MHDLLKPASATILLLACLVDCSHGGFEFGQLIQAYDGGTAYPSVSVDGLQRTPRFACRLIETSNTQPAYSNIPSALAWSYPSLSYSAQQTSELGNFVQLAGTGRIADHLEVVMVTWAAATRYPEWSSKDSAGYIHPITARIYQPSPLSGEPTTFQLVDESTVHVTIPWKPALLPNGTVYPYNGFAFKVLIPLSARVTVPESCVVSIAYQTELSGSSPVGTPGPYNDLNVALSSAKPVTGVDPDPSSVFWIKGNQWFYPATGWGGVGSPMITLRTRPTALPTPILSSSLLPLHAGTYHLNASIVSPAMEASAVLRITKATANILPAGLERSVTDAPPCPLFTTDPPGLPCIVTYAGSPVVPTSPGTHAFEAIVNTMDHEGSLKGTYVLTAERYEQWRDSRMAGMPETLTRGRSDPDGDGSCNWIEYATGGNPVAIDSLPQPTRTQAGMKLSYRYRRGMSLLRIDPEFSEDLRTWSEANTTVEPHGDLWETRTATVDQSTGFFRLKARSGTGP